MLWQLFGFANHVIILLEIVQVEPGFLVVHVPPGLSYNQHHSSSSTKKYLAERS